MRQIETIKPFLPNSPHNHWACVTGQFTEEEPQIRDWILWSALAPAQGVVNGQFDTKYHCPVGAGDNYQTGITSLVLSLMRHITCVHIRYNVTRREAWSLALATGQAELCRPSCQESSGVWSIPKYELNYRMNFSWACSCTTLSLSLLISSLQSTPLLLANDLKTDRFDRTYSNWNFLAFLTGHPFALQLCWT